MAERQLQCTTAAAEHQKAWFADLRREVFERRRPYAIVQADMPLELFQVEKPHLLPLPPQPYDTAVIRAVLAGRRREARQRGEPGHAGPEVRGPEPLDGRGTAGGR